MHLRCYSHSKGTIQKIEKLLQNSCMHIHTHTYMHTLVGACIHSLKSFFHHSNHSTLLCAFHPFIRYHNSGCLFLCKHTADPIWFYHLCSSRFLEPRRLLPSGIYPSPLCRLPSLPVEYAGVDQAYETPPLRNGMNSVDVD